MKNIMVFTITLFLVACGSQVNGTNINDVEIDENEVSNNEAINNENEELNEDEDKDKETLANEYKESIENEDSTKISDDIKSFEEYDTLNDEIDLSEAQIDLIEDNYGKRILLIKDKDGEKTHKSIYSKKVNKLKIIEFDGGEIFNDVINEEEEE